MNPLLRRFTLLFFLISVSGPALAERWDRDSFTVAIGSPVASQAGLTLQPNEQSQVLVGLPQPGLSLDDNFRIRARFTGAVPSAIFVVWRNDREDKLHQHGVRPSAHPELHIDMRGVPGWEGNAVSLELGFLIPSLQPITVLEVSLDRPGMIEELGNTWSNWASYRGWEAVDINLHTGTRNFGEGPHPVPAFAGLAAAAIALYLLLRRRRSRISEAAVILLCVWIALDGLWQFRLWRQLADTREQYAGLGSTDKLLASEDAALVRLGQKIQEIIPAASSRLFVASSSDGWGMLAAYHVSPVNVYWHRHGPELPNSEYIVPGDYILLLLSSSIPYRPGQGLIRLENGQELRVEERFIDRAGFLLEVL